MNDLEQAPAVFPMKDRRSRAVSLDIVAGESAYCKLCDQRIVFSAKYRHLQRIVCNVYVRRVWKRVEQYHPSCYDAAGRPYGDPAKYTTRREVMAEAAGQRAAAMAR